jgi:hypothetical protein
MTTVGTRTSSLVHLVGLLNRLANRVLIPLLESSLGDSLGRRLAVLDYVGRRSGRPHRLVVGYAAEGRSVRITVGMAEAKTWWRNFETPHPLTLRLAGIDHHVFAHVVHDGDGTEVIADLEFTEHPEVSLPDQTAADRAAPKGLRG